MSFLELKPSDVISTVYTVYPNYTFTIFSAAVDWHSGPIYLFNPSSSVGQSRTHFDEHGYLVTGSYQLTGTVQYVRFINNFHKFGITRLKSIYASSSFLKPQNYSSSSIFSASSILSESMAMINIPSLVYGTEIKPGSFTLSVTSPGVIHNYSDDSYGGIYTGSVLIGCIFYQHGIAAFGHDFTSMESTAFKMTVDFSGTQKIPMNVYLCRAPKGLLNSSNNPSFVSYMTSSNSSEISTTNPKTFIVGIGLYDENYKLVGIAKTSSPILNEEQNSILYRLKLNF